MKTEDRRTCQSCGNEFSGAMEFCPVCTFRKALAAGIESGGSSFNDTLMPATEQATQRFEHYELVKDADGKPVELGRGAMGVTYKAFDVDLHCPVTLNSSMSDMSVMNPRGFVFYGKRGRRRVFVTRMWPRFSI